MDTNFWKKRWKTNQVGWHATETNKHLECFVSTLGASAGGWTLVPLCGKSMDMDYLARQNRKVVGVELSSIACRAFFAETKRAYTERTTDKFTYFESEDVVLVCGDIFSVSSEDLPPIEACYDRACLVAFTMEQRHRYAKWLASTMPSGACSLVIGIEYPAEEKDGPPFTVPSDELHSLFDQTFAIEQLHREDIVDKAPKYREWGVTSLIETVYSMFRR